MFHLSTQKLHSEQSGSRIALWESLAPFLNSLLTVPPSILKHKIKNIEITILGLL
jgi:hypothetical protein